MRQRTSGSLAPSQLATALLLHPDSLVSGGTRHLNGLKDLLAQSVSSTRSGQLRVVLGIRPQAQGRRIAPASRRSHRRPRQAAAAPGRAGRSGDSPVRELLEWRRMFDTKLVEITDYGFAAITRLKVDDALLAGVERLGWRLVVGSATELSGLAEAYQRAWSLRGRVGTTGRSVRVDDVTWSVAGLLGKEAGAMLAARLLAPVLALAPERRDALLGILRAWLGENGSWDATAKATGLHRNSIRRQIGMLAELLELDLNQAQARAELWIALQYTDELPGMPPAPARPRRPGAGAGQLPQER